VPIRFELLAMGAVVDPLARRHNPFAGGNGGSVTHHRYDVTMAARPRAQHAEASIFRGGGILRRSSRRRSLLTATRRKPKLSLVRPRMALWI
jgi:hypothetical protein